MKGKHGHWLLLLLFGFTVVCLLTAAPHRMLYGLMALETVCCHNLEMLLPVVTTLPIVLLARTVLLITVLLSASMLVRRIWKNQRFVARLQAALSIGITTVLPPRLAALCDQLGFAHQVVVLPTATLLAFCFGLLTPRIYISTGLVQALTDRELQAVLLHEDHHRRRRDPLRTLLADVLATIFFFLPVVAEWRNFFLTAAELAADRYTARIAGRISLAGALHKFLSSASDFQFPIATGGISGFSVTQARLAQLLDDAPTTLSFSRRNLICSSLILLVGCIALQISLF
jgi:Zn-dependent protease with chaperone function